MQNSLADEDKEARNQTRAAAGLTELEGTLSARIPRSLRDISTA